MTAIQAAVDRYRVRTIVVSDRLPVRAKTHLLKTAQAPIICIHSMKPPTFSGFRVFTKLILVPLDKSEFTGLALPYAMNMARSANVPVILLTVVPSLRDILYMNAVAAGQPASFLADQLLQEHENVIAQDAHQYLVNIRKMWDQCNDGKVLTRVEYGNEAYSIVNCAKLYDVEAIIMSSRHHNILSYSV